MPEFKVYDVKSLGVDRLTCRLYRECQTTAHTVTPTPHLHVLGIDDFENVPNGR
jgi:hypothetical protein